MKHRLLIIFILSALQIITLSVFSQDTPYDPNRLYPVNQLKADLRFLRARLDSIHPDLYRYTSGKSYSTFFDSLDRIITRPMPEQAFLGLVTLLNEMICDGHTMFLPSEAATEYNNARGRFLPFSIAYINGRSISLKTILPTAVFNPAPPSPALTGKQHPLSLQSC